jgi:hypothetical protein
MPTISSELDRLSAEVLEVLGQTRPARNYAAAAPALFTRFAIRVTPDNLRAWHVRRVAVDLAERTPVDVRCEIDDYAEAIQVWRADRRTWATISRLLDDGFGFIASAQTLRGWWWRRKNRGAKAEADGSAVARGVATIEPGSPAPILGQAAPTATAGPQAPASPSLSPAPAPTQPVPMNRVLPGETETQRRIREKRQAQAAQTGIQDHLLERLAAAGSVAPTDTPSTEVSP